MKDDRDIDDYNLSRIQKRMLKQPCPACEVGSLYPVESDSNNEENYDVLWCDSCDCSVDDSGGYVA